MFGTNSAIKAFLFNRSSFFDLCFVSAVQVVALITFSIKHCCIVGQKEFSRKTEDRKLQSFSWNEFTSDNSCFESEQFFYSTLFGRFLGHLLSRKMNQNIMAKVQK